MSSLTVNSIEIPVEPGIGDRPEEIGVRRERTPTGDLRFSYSARQRVLSGRTTLLTTAQAASVRGLCAGLGARFGFDGSVLSSRKHYPSGVYTLIDSESLSGTTNPKLGTGCVAIDGGTTNLLSANASYARTDATGWAAVDGATLTRVTTAAYVKKGTAALKIVTSAAVNGVKGGAVLFDQATLNSAGDPHAATLYVLAPVSGSWEFTFYDEVGGVGAPIATATVALTAGVWTRVVLTGTAGGGAVEGYLQILEHTADSGATLYMSGAQVENTSAHGAFPTAYADPNTAAGVRAASSGLVYSLGYLRGAEARTVGLWARPMNPDSANVQSDVWRMGDATNGVDVYFDVGGITAACAVVGAAGASITYVHNPSGWEHWTVVLDPGGSTKLRLLLNGVSVGTSNGSVPNLRQSTAFRLGGSAVAFQSNIYADELLVFPFALTTEHDLASYTRAWPNLPQVALGGTLIGANEILALPGEEPELLREFWTDGSSSYADGGHVTWKFLEIPGSP